MSIFKKHLINHPYLYITTFEKSPQLPCVIFVHGGPGLNCGVLEALIEVDEIFNSLGCNIVLYDQRGCGRSKSKDGDAVLHADNVTDLDSVVAAVSEHHGASPVAIVGHSYGAKVLFDYLRTTGSKLPSIFVSTALSVLTPRLNNLLLDLCYLKSANRDQYKEMLEAFNDFENGSIWAITDKLTNVFHENENRPNFYWANMDWRDTVISRQKETFLPMNTEVFTSVRQDLYSLNSNYSVDIRTLKNNRCMWINGFHDYIMDGKASLCNPALKTIIFYKSSHYPHIEEHERFCKEINAFINN